MAQSNAPKVVNKRVFDTDNALKGTFNGLFGRWQLITYSFFVYGYAIVIAWVNGLLDFNMLGIDDVNCSVLTPNNASGSMNSSVFSAYKNRSVVQRLSGKSKYYWYNNDTNSTIDFTDEFNKTYGKTVVTDYAIYCDLSSYVSLPKLVHTVGAMIGALLLGFASDRGGRKIIILGCLWTSGIMSLFQLVGHDYISFVFFQFFIGLFIGGVQASFLPAIIEMFPINFRAFYGVCFHLVVSLFQILLPWLAKSFRNWIILQTFVTVPIILTAALQFFAYESIFWYLAHKEYDRAIKTLSRLAKRNGIEFESKFKQAKEFLHAKHSKATQVDILPFLRLEDARELKDKYPQIDMTELQKKKANSSKLRFFLNSLKGKGYRSTNTIYRPFDFVYSPTLLVYVIILCGLWFTNGLADSIDIDDVMNAAHEDYFTSYTLTKLTCVGASSLAVFLAVFKFGRRWMIFLAYLLIEICLLGSLIAKSSYEGHKESQHDAQVALVVLYHLCKFSTFFGLIFLMLITAEIFPTSLRCTGMGICTIVKLLGSLIASKDLLGFNDAKYRLAYCLLTLFFGSMSLFLPETKTFPLPRSILQIEAMPTPIGKKLRSRKAKLAYERRQTLYANENNNLLRLNEQSVDFMPKRSNMNLSTSASTSGTNQKQPKVDAVPLIELNVSSKQSGPSSPSKEVQHDSHTIEEQANARPSTSLLSNDDHMPSDPLHSKYASTYDTVTSVHDIEQDDHIYYGKEAEQPSLLMSLDKKLTKILEVPSKNITRNNSVTDVSENPTNSKV